MRALAYGILDPEGERYRLALMHRSQCPACRAYVASLRGLAAVLPPVFLPRGLGAGVLARAGEGVHAGGTAGAASGGAGGAGGGAGAGLQAGRGLGGALSASGAAGAGGAAGGGWLLGAGPLGAKLAVGCLLALGVGAGCIALDGGHRALESHHGRHRASRSSAGASARTPAAYQLGDLADGVGRSLSAAARGDTSSSALLTPSARTSREFGPEQALAPGAAEPPASASRHASAARSASSGSRPPLTDAGSSAGGSSRVEASAPAGGQSTPGPATGDSTVAEREFSPG